MDDACDLGNRGNGRRPGDPPDAVFPSSVATRKSGFSWRRGARGVAEFCAVVLGVFSPAVVFEQLSGVEPSEVGVRCWSGTSVCRAWIGIVQLHTTPDRGFRPDCQFHGLE